MKVGDFVQSNMWFPHRKAWDEKRTGLIVDKEWVEEDYVKILEGS